MNNVVYFRDKQNKEDHKYFLKYVDLVKESYINKAIGMYITTTEKRIGREVTDEELSDLAIEYHSGNIYVNMGVVMNNAIPYVVIVEVKWRGNEEAWKIQ